MPLYSTNDSPSGSISTPPSINKLCDFIDTCLREDSVLHFGEFCNDFSKILVDQLPNKVNDLIIRSLVYFKSDYPELAASAVLLIGIL